MERAGRCNTDHGAKLKWPLDLEIKPGVFQWAEVSDQRPHSEQERPSRKQSHPEKKDPEKLGGQERGAAATVRWDDLWRVTQEKYIAESSRANKKKTFQRQKTLWCRNRITGQNWSENTFLTGTAPSLQRKIKISVCKLHETLMSVHLYFSS